MSTTTETEAVEAHPESALSAAITAAVMAEPVIDGPHGKRHALVPPGFKVEELIDADARPVYPQASAIFDDAASLTNYVNRFQNPTTILIADYDDLCVRAYLDFHAANDDDTSAAAGMLRHCATLQLRKSEEYSRWSQAEGILHDQMDFARFMEENASDISDPDPATFIEISRDLEAAQGTNFKASSRTQTGDRSFSYEVDTVVKHDLVVPTQFQLSIPLFEGEPPDDITAYFRFKPTGDGLRMGFDWRRVEYVRRARFNELAFRIAEDTACPVTMGRLST